MFDQILRLYWTVSRKRHLLSFFNGLNSLGRPGRVLFPVELLDQGLELLLSGLNNTLAMQSNLDWIWPYWIEQQQNPHHASFIPTGINLVTTNLSQRNWISLGNPQSRFECMVDPVGMVTLHRFGWSLLPYLKNGSRTALPSRLAGIRQQLVEQTLPWVTTDYPEWEGIAWSATLAPLRVEGVEVVELRYTLTNRHTTPQTVTFGLAIRPYNPLTIGHINQIHYADHLWSVNRQPALLLLEPPHHLAVSDRHSSDPILTTTPTPSPPLHATSRSGIASAISEYQLQLEAGQSRTLTFVGALQPNTRPHQLAPLTLATLATARQSSRSYWQSHQQRGLRVTLPDRRWQHAFYALKNHLPAFDDGSHFSPGTFFYHGHWFRDSAFIAAAFDGLGLSEAVEQKIPHDLKRQSWSGFFRSQNGEWDSNGQAMVTLVNHIRLTGATHWLEPIYPALRRGVRWIERMRHPLQPPRGALNYRHGGLLPAGFSAEHFGPNDHYLWDNFWSLAGIEATLWVAEQLNQHRDQPWLQRLLTEYRATLQQVIDHATQTNPTGALPCSPYRRIDSAAIGNLVAISPLNLYPPDAAWVAPTVEYLWQQNISQGLFYQKIIHTGLNIYLSAQLARVLLLRHDLRWQTIFESILDHASATLTWPEAIHPGTGGGCMGDGDHGWAAADTVMLIRQALVAETEEGLLLGLGIPAAWFQVGAVIALDHAPTRYGHLSYRLEQQPTTLLFQWQCQPHSLSQRGRLALLLPRSFLTPEPTQPRPAGRQQVTLPALSGQLLFHYRPESPPHDATPTE